MLLSMCVCTGLCVLVAVQTKLYSPDQLNELMSVSDYIVMATPWTPQTDKV